MQAPQRHGLGDLFQCSTDDRRRWIEIQESLTRELCVDRFDEKLEHCRDAMQPFWHLCEATVLQAPAQQFEKQGVLKLRMKQRYTGSNDPVSVEKPLRRLVLVFGETMVDLADQ